jgi:hypothetical protein
MPAAGFRRPVMIGGAGGWIVRVSWRPLCFRSGRHPLPKSMNRRYRTAIGDTVEPEPP